MDIPISFKIYLQWKNLFNKKDDNHQIKISKEGRGVRSILFFLPHIDNVKLFTFNDEDLNYFDTIKSVLFMDKIRLKNYDAIVDLNTEFCAATTMLAFELDAPLKIGFDSIVNRKIFTITLERKENTFLESYFSRILNLLGVKL